MADLIELTVGTSDLERAMSLVKRFGDQTAIAANKGSKAYLSNNREFRSNLALVRNKITMSSRLQKQMERENNLIQRMTVSQNAYNGATQRSTKGMSRFGLVAQQTGYQVGDFLVQIQSGTNAMVAFGQQGTQLAGLLTGRFVFLGAAIGILLPLATALGAYFMRTADGAKEAGNEVEKLAKSFRMLEQVDLSGFSQQALSDIDPVLSKYTTLLQTIRDVATEQRDTALGSILESIAPQGEIEQLQVEISRIQELANEAGNGQNAQLTKMNQKLSEQTAIRKALLGIQGETREEVAKNLDIALATLDAQGLLTKEIKAQLVEFADGAGLAAAMRKEIEDSASAAEDAANSTDRITRSLSNAVNQAISLRDALANVSTAALGRAQEIVVLQAKISAAGRNVPGSLTQSKEVARSEAMAKTAQQLSGTGASLDIIAEKAKEAGDQAARLVDLRNQLTEGTKAPSATRGGTSSSGGGGGSAADTGIGAFAKSLLDETEALDIWYEESLLKLEEFNSEELRLLGEHAGARARIEEEYQNRMNDIRRAERTQTLSDTANLFGALQGIAQAGGKGLAKAAAVFGAVEATINSYVAATAALRTPGLSLAGRFAAYASVLATGLQGVAAIRQAGGVGGGGGGGGGSQAIATPEAQAAPQRVILQGLDPNSIFTGAMLSDLFDRFYDENDERGAVFVVSR